MITKAVEIFENQFSGLATQFSLKPFQERVINQVLENGSTLAIMPTGGGKSLIYWVTAKALGGTCLVVSPFNTPDNFSGGWEESRPPYRVQMSLNKSH
jgi:ATP-dependent DNA helicase RecQ